jgi:hypothetical protein
MDKTVILFLVGLGLGIFVGNLSMPSDLAGLDNSGEEITVAATIPIPRCDSTVAKSDGNSICPTNTPIPKPARKRIIVLSILFYPFSLSQQFRLHTL